MLRDRHVAANRGQAKFPVGRFLAATIGTGRMALADCEAVTTGSGPDDAIGLSATAFEERALPETVKDSETVTSESVSDLEVEEHISQYVSYHRGFSLGGSTFLRGQIEEDNSGRPAFTCSPARLTVNGVGTGLPGCSGRESNGDWCDVEETVSDVMNYRFGWGDWSRNPLIDWMKGGAQLTVAAIERFEFT